LVGAYGIAPVLINILIGGASGAVGGGGTRNTPILTAGHTLSSCLVGIGDVGASGQAGIAIQVIGNSATCAVGE